MFVLTADQHASRDNRDRVPDALVLLKQTAPTLAFERTVGDEIQGVFTSAHAILHATLLLFSQGSWHVGIGAGPADLPLAGSARESRGEAFILARAAVENAKNTSPSLVVAGRDPRATEEANSLWRLLAAIWEKRTPAGWEAALAVYGTDLTQAAAAQQIGISQQALSARLRSSMWGAEVAVHPLACRLLSLSEGEGS